MDQWESRIIRTRKMLTVDSCLCCRLETGGLVIGWLTLITSILGSISLLGFLLVLCIYNCNDMAKLFDNWTYEDLELCNGLRGVLIGVFFLLLGFIVLVGFFGFRCIQGTKARDHFRVKPLMILMAISTVLSLLQVLTFRSYAIV
ncbi:hypothetical protein Bhyg_15291, partial [Pseudolycoriella hygida]